MKSHRLIGHSLSRIIVSLLLTSPTLFDYSYDYANTGFALALPAPADDHRQGLPNLRTGLPAAGRLVKRDAGRRHGDHEDEGEEGHGGMSGGAASAVDTPDLTTSSSVPPFPAGSHEELHTPEDTQDEERLHEHIESSQDQAPDGSQKDDHAAHSDSDQPDNANHGHVHHASSWVPLTEFNETDVLVKHGPAPLSFLYHDFVLDSSQTLAFRRTGVSMYGNATTEMSNLQQDDFVAWQREQYIHGSGSLEETRVMGGDGRPHPGLMALHVISFSLAYFAVLPITLALRAAKLTSVAYGISKLVFGVLVFLGWIVGVWYKAATPELYVGHKHNISGNLLLLATVAIGAIDLLAVGRRIYRFATNDEISFQAFIDIVLRSHGEKSDMEEYESVALANQMELDDLDEENTQMKPASRHQRHGRGNPVIFTAPWANRADGEHLNSRSSNSSDASTLRDSPVFASPHEMDKSLQFPTRGVSITSSGPGRHFDRPPMSEIHEHVDARLTPTSRTTRQKLVRVGTYLMHFLSRGLIVWAYIVAIMGIVVYTGMGRKWFLPSLLAHLIKGSIFFW
jgi:hypothetical protein